MPETGNPSDNLAVLEFPQLSRKPALKTRRAMIDPTLRDSLENGMEATRPRFRRPRRQWSVSIDLLTPADCAALDDFVTKQALYGSVEFLFADERDPHNPKQLIVRFSLLPAYNDAGNVEGEFRQNCTFELREL